MGSSEAIQEFVANEDGAAVFLARIYGVDGTFTQSLFGSITRYVKDTRTGQVVSASVTVATSVYDTLQTNSIQWPFSTGYNFRDVIPASALADGRRYIVQYKFTPSAGEVFWTKPVGVSAIKNAAS